MTSTFPAPPARRRSAGSGEATEASEERPRIDRPHLNAAPPRGGEGGGGAAEPTSADGDPEFCVFARYVPLPSQDLTVFRWKREFDVAIPGEIPS